MSSDRILQWAIAHCEREGRWPRVASGPIPDAPGENWATINAALTRGHRGLPGGSSLAHLPEQAGAPAPGPALRGVTAAQKENGSADEGASRELSPHLEAPRPKWLPATFPVHQHATTPGLLAVRPAQPPAEHETTR